MYCIAQIQREQKQVVEGMINQSSLSKTKDIEASKLLLIKAIVVAKKNEYDQQHHPNHHDIPQDIHHDIHHHHDNFACHLCCTG